MRIRGDDGIALSLIQDGQGHQQGMPSIARWGETFVQTDFETVVGILGKLVGRITDERDALDVIHDEEEKEDARRRVRGVLL